MVSSLHSADWKQALACTKDLHLRRLTSNYCLLVQTNCLRFTYKQQTTALKPLKDCLSQQLSDNFTKTERLAPR